MGVVENIKFLCNQKGTSIPKLGSMLGFGNGAIYNWDKTSPSIDKIQKVADFFDVSTDFIIIGFDKEIENLIKELAVEHNGSLRFPEEVVSLMKDKLSSIKEEYPDVPLDLQPTELIGLLNNFPVSSEFKKELLDALKDVRTSLNQYRHYEVNTIAAHHDGDEWSEEELEEIERFKEFVRMKRGHRTKE